MKNKLVITVLLIQVMCLKAQQTFTVNPVANTLQLEAVRDQIQSVNQNMTGDITVILNDGLYTLDRTFELNELDGGTNGYKIIWKSQTPGGAQLTGGVVIDGWTLHDATNNIWKADADGIIFRNMYVNTDKATRAREPNWDGDGDKGPYYYGAQGNKVARNTVVPASVIGDWENLNEVEMITYPSWYHQRLRISEITGTGTNRTIEYQEPDRTNGYNKDFNFYTNAYYYFENAYEFLDDEGEWYLNTGENTVYYKPITGQNMSTIEVIVPSPDVETLIEIRGADASNKFENVDFDGISFSHTTWLYATYNGINATQAVQPVNHAGYVNTADGQETNTGQVTLPAGMIVEWADEINFYNCVFNKMGAQGLQCEDGVKNMDIDGCTFTNIGANALVLNKNYTVGVTPSDDVIMEYVNVTNSTFIRCGDEYSNGMGVLANVVRHTRFANNLFTELPYTATQCS